MNSKRAAITALCVAVLPLMPKAAAVDIDVLAKSIDLEKGWKLDSISRGKKKDGKVVELPWALLKGPTGGEMVTIIVNEDETGGMIRTPETCCDSSHEYCLEGLPYWIKASRGVTIHSLHCKETTLLREGFLALEYTYITERDTGNLMAHGLVLFGDASVYVQHTSSSPITREISQYYGNDVMTYLGSVSAPGNLNRELTETTDQPAADQPASALKSKAEGNEKPKPESEGRSQ